MAKQNKSDVREDVRNAIKDLYPGNTVQIDFTPDDSYLAKIYDDLRGKLSGIKKAAVMYEHDESSTLLPADDGGDDGDPKLWDSDDEPPMNTEDFHCSYFTLFIGLTGKDATFETEGPTEEEDGTLENVPGIGHCGCTVVISWLAPYALIRLASMENYEDGTYTTPEIDPDVFTMDFRPADLEVHYREFMGDEVIERMKALRENIVHILEGFGIAMIGTEEAEKPVPSLRAGEGVLIGPKDTGHKITVKDALFFRAL